MNLKDNWARILGWLEQNAPATAERLRAPGSPEKLAELEALAGGELPGDVREFLLLTSGAEGSAIFPNLHSEDMAFSPMAVDRILHAWNMQNELLEDGDFEDMDEDVENDAGVAKEYWSVGWMPLADDGGGDYYCVDLAPAEGGARGQLITFCGDDRKLLAGSLGDYISKLADRMERGEIRISEDYGLVH